MNRFLYIFYLVITIMPACSEKSFNPNDTASSFIVAKKPYDSGYYEVAIQKLGEFRSRFPYSRYSIDAELLVANCYFKLGQYMEAADAYEKFVKLHPKHAKVAFAMYKDGESYWRESPVLPSRDQEMTIQALDKWVLLKSNFPQSSYAQKAQANIVIGKKRLAQAAQFVVQFYCKQRIWSACAYRAVEMLKKYQDFKDLKLFATQKAALAFRHLANEETTADRMKQSNLYFRNYSKVELKNLASQYERQFKMMSK